jgi:hypothetical protein
MEVIIEAEVREWFEVKFNGLESMTFAEDTASGAGGLRHFLIHN